MLIKHMPAIVISLHHLNSTYIPTFIVIKRNCLDINSSTKKKFIHKRFRILKNEGTLLDKGIGHIVQGRDQRS